MPAVSSICSYCGEVIVDPKFASLDANISDRTYSLSFSCLVCGMTNTNDLPEEQAILMMIAGVSVRKGLGKLDKLNEKKYDKLISMQADDSFPESLSESLAGRSWLDDLYKTNIPN